MWLNLEKVDKRGWTAKKGYHFADGVKKVVSFLGKNRGDTVSCRPK